MIEYLREYERGKPQQHPIGMTGAPIVNAALFHSPADWISRTSKDGYNTNPPAADGRKVIIADVDHVYPKTGTSTDGKPVKAVGHVNFAPPFAGDAVLYLKVQ